MKDKELIIKQRKELADGLKELTSLVNEKPETIKEKRIKEIIYATAGIIRAMDWTLDDSDLAFEEYCVKGNDEFAKEFNLEV